ncbi:MAG: M14 metallopeptidase family protein [Acidobacteriota bacterium]
MTRRFLALALSAALWSWGAVPTPKEHFGFTPGDDYKLADYAEVTGYFKKLAGASDRIRLVEFGKSAHGKPMYVAFISAPENLKELDRYRGISRRLALGEAAPDEARRLAAEGKAIVWIDSGLHASEVAPVQHAPHLAYRMLTDEGEEAQRIRRQVILLQVPVINPDGLDWVAHWYRKNAGTPYELARLPWLYHKYAGHDNNRDWFMLNLEETRHVTRMLFQEWFPQILYNQHQTSPFPSRIFMPPHADPLNPNVQPAVNEGINLIGAAMKDRFLRENKPGAISHVGFDAWWNGGLRTVPVFHNMHGILTETAGFAYAHPRTYKASEFPERFANGMPTREPTIFYPRPWMGGTWTLRDAIEYMLTADLAILELASARSSYFLHKAWEMARAAIEEGKKGKPYAYVIAPEQWDRSSALEMLRRLSLGGVQVGRARAAFEAGKKSYPADTYVLLAGQPFRPYLMDLLEPQKYPELRTGESGPTKRPYDIAGWTLSMQMGVAVDRIDEPFQTELAPVSQIELAAPTLDQRENAAYLAVAETLAHGAKVRRAADGALLAEDRAAAEAFSKAAWELRRPRVALYEPWGGNMDTGWTQWLLDYYKIPHTLAHNDEFQKGALRDRFDTVILASQSGASILHGTRLGESPAPVREGASGAAPEPRSIQRPEYTGGIGLRGLVNLDEFVRAGGTLIAFDNAAELPIQFFPLPLRSALRPGSSAFYCPGSLLRITVENAHPLAFGMPKEAIAFSSGGPAWDVALLPEFNKGEQEVRVVARYAASNLLASGWVSGEKPVLGKAAMVEARHGRGRVVLFGFRPQFRGQPFGTFKFLLNAIYLASAEALAAP